MTAVVEPAEGGRPRVAGISYVGFSKKYDETIELGAGRLRPLDLGPPVEGPSQPLRPDAAQPGGDIYVVDRVLEVPLASLAPPPLGSPAPRLPRPLLLPRAPSPGAARLGCGHRHVRRSWRRQHGRTLACSLVGFVHADVPGPPEASQIEKINKYGTI